MTRAIEGQRLFHRDADYRRYVGLLQLVTERQRWSLMTLVLMPNHVHLLTAAAVTSLSEGMWWLNWQYAEYYKRVYRPRLGHVFGGRPKFKPIEDDTYLLAAARYIALNPVGVLVERPEQYRWSTHAAIVGHAPRLPFLAADDLLGFFGPGDSVDRYERFVTGAEPGEHRTIRLWAGRAEARPALEMLVADPTPAALLVAHETWDYTLREIAEATGISHSTVRRQILRARG